MNSALSLSLILALITSAMPVGAQEQAETPRAFDLGSPTTGPIARAAAREALRLGATSEPTRLITENVEQGPQSGLSDWSRLRQLAPHTEIVVTVKGARPARRTFVAADNSELIVAR